MSKEIAMMYYGDHMSGWGWFAMSFSAVVFWGLLIVAIVLLVRHLHTGAPAQHRANPEQVLAERFARGEIDENEYRDRLAALRGSMRS
jgi:putative membrane protein